MWKDAAYLIGALLLVLLNGFFVAAEFALVKVRPTRIEELVAKGSAPARSTQNAIRHLDAYLSATQLGITLASLGLGWIGEPAFARLLEPLFEHFNVPIGARHPASLAVAFTIITFLHIVFGELAPKSLAIQKSQSTALAVAWPLGIFYRLFKVPIVILNGTANLFLRMIGIQPAGEHDLVHSPEELNLIVQGSFRGGMLASTEAEIAREALILHGRTARDIIVPRVDMVFLTTSLSLAENMERANRAGYTRFPLCDPDADHVIGMVHIKDLLSTFQKPDATILDARRDILMIPETKPLDSLLREFQTSRVHIAVVLDEYGGTLGIVTLEDVLEEIVGDIQDEHQHETPDVQLMGENGYTVDGGVTLDDLDHDFGIVLESDEAETLGGYLQWRLGAVPEPGQEVQANGFLLRVDEMEGRRIRRVIITRNEPENVPAVGPMSGAENT